MNQQPEQQASASASAPTSVVAPNSTPPVSASAPIRGSDLQQALFHSMNNMMSSQDQSWSNPMQQGQGMNNSGNNHRQGLSQSQMDLVHQLLGNMNNGNNQGPNNNMAASAMPPSASAPFSQPVSQQQPPSNQGSYNSNNNSIVNQLVASLQAQQAQQQSQQQAQVQAAISRAFGPSNNQGGQGMPPNNPNLFSQMQLAQAQGLVGNGGGANNFLSPFGNSMNMDNGDFRNGMFQLNQGFEGKRAMMGGHSMGEGMMKKPKIDNSSMPMNNNMKFGSGNLFSSIPGLQNSLFPPNNPMSNLPLQHPGAFDSEMDLHQKLAGARGAVIVPCRARGMPVDHNFKTAYFVIPDGIEHGDELFCSFPACREAGVKFRYCVDCKVPVAKRNFRNRHRHGVPGGDGGSISGEEGDEDDSSGEDDKPEAKDPNQNDFAAPDGPGLCMSAEGAPQRMHLIVVPDKPKKKKSGNVRVPCRARGMPMAHNFKTAHFIIPPNIQHGDELVCSFPPCRSAGAKFRYCLHCKVPVAKRNFRNRHKHGGMGEKKKAGASPSPSQDKKDAAEEEKAEEKPEKEPSVQDTEEDTEKNEGDLKPSALPTAATDASRTATASASMQNNTVAINSTQDPERVQQWVSLLDTKPDPSDKQAMAVWMMNLMHATEAMSSRPPEARSSKSQSPAETAIKSEPTPQSPAEGGAVQSESKPAGAEGPVKSEEMADNFFDV